jgi:hypothetical protein
MPCLTGRSNHTLLRKDTQSCSCCKEIAYSSNSYYPNDTVVFSDCQHVINVVSNALVNESIQYSIEMLQTTLKIPKTVTVDDLKEVQSIVLFQGSHKITYLVNPCEFSLTISPTSLSVPSELTIGAIAFSEIIFKTSRCQNVSSFGSAQVVA